MKFPLEMNSYCDTVTDINANYTMDSLTHCFQGHTDEIQHYEYQFSVREHNVFHRSFSKPGVSNMCTQSSQL